MAETNLEYGKRAGGNGLVFSWPVGASEVFKRQGGGFVTIDANGRAEIAIAGDLDIIGYALLNVDRTASATEGGDTVRVDLSHESVYEVPINAGTWADTMLGKLCDISVVAGIQGVDLGASGENVVQLINKGTTNKAGTVVSVLCRLHARTLVPAGLV